VDARCATLNDIRGAELRQVLQPEAGALRLWMAELPRLNALRKLGVIPNQLLRMRVHDRVLDADVRYRSIPHIGEKLSTFAKLPPHLVEGFAGRCLVKPAYATVAETGAGRMRNDQEVPSVIEDLASIALNMPVAVVFGGQQVA